MLVLATLCFATFVLHLLAARSHDRTAASNWQAENVPAAFGGRLDIRTMDDLRVGSRKIMLCGVSFAKPRALEQFIRMEARRAFQSTQLDCVQVGGGTPCDNRAAASFGDALVAQCFTSDKLDIAREFSARGFLCDLPALSGGVYHAC